MIADLDIDFMCGVECQTFKEIWFKILIDELILLSWYRD